MPYPYPTVLPPRTSVEHAAVIDGVESRWWEFGAAPRARTIVFVHGFRGDHHGLTLLADALPEFRILIPDLPGFGASDVWPNSTRSIEDFGRWLSAFRRHTSTLTDPVLGHSFGSVVVANAVRDTTTAPVILVNPISRRALSGPRRVLAGIANLWYRIGQLVPERAGNALLSAPIVVRTMSVVLAKTTDRALRRWIHDQHARYFSNYASRSSLIAAYAVSVSATVTEFAPRVSAPVLLIAADRDDVTTLEDQRAVQRVFPDAQLEVLRGVGHLVHYERPLEAGEAIRQFLENHT